MKSRIQVEQQRNQLAYTNWKNEYMAHLREMYLIIPNHLREKIKFEDFCQYVYKNTIHEKNKPTPYI